jgi:hypothetical protein
MAAETPGELTSTSTSLSNVTKNMPSTAVRRGLRGLALLPSVMALTVAGPAFAEPPATWEEAENPSVVSALLLIIGVPALLFLVITVLASLPSMIGGQKGDAALAFRDNPEWFGGPRQGVEVAPEDAGDSQGRGGTSAHW